MKSIFFFLFLAFIYSGCDLFKTRDPQSPTNGTSGFQPPVTPEIVLDNFTNAIRQHSIDNYMRCFVDSTLSSRSFSFVPSGDFQGMFHTWGLDDERRYFENLGLPVNSAPFLNFINLKQENRTSSSTEFTMEYFLFYPHHKPNVSKQVKGYMHLYLETDSRQQWSIYKWEDARSVTDSTWSYLKYSLY